MTELVKDYRIVLERCDTWSHLIPQDSLMAKHIFELEEYIVFNFLDGYLYNLLEYKDGVFDAMFLDTVDTIMNAVYTDSCDVLLSETYEESLSQGDYVIWVFLDEVENNFSAINEIIIRMVEPLFIQLNQYVGRGLFTNYIYNNVYINVYNSCYEIILSLTDDIHATGNKNRFRFSISNENGKRINRTFNGTVY